MAKRNLITFIILILGSFAIPTIIYACGTKTTKTEKSCCKKAKSEKDNKKDCCKKSNSKSEKDENGCDGKCNNSNCSCPSRHFAFAMPVCAELKVKKYFTESKTTKLCYNENYLSDGFVSIWTPPNIS